MLVLRNVTKTYGDRNVLDDVSVRIDPGEMTCLLGPSGCGKTTLLSLLVGVTAPTGGTVEIDGVDLRTVPEPALQLYRRRVGVVFQDFKLFPTRTVFENVAFPLEICGATAALTDRRVSDMLQRLDLTMLANAFPDELSTGEQARVAVARAAVHQPLIVLADEPTESLDADEAAAVVDVLRSLQAKGSTVVIATHNIGLTELLQTRVIGLENGKVMGQGMVRKAKKQTATEDRKHEVFVGSDDLSQHEETPGEPEKEERKKIRITSIHSD